MTNRGEVTLRYSAEWRAAVVVSCSRLS